MARPWQISVLPRVSNGKTNQEPNKKRQNGKIQSRKYTGKDGVERTAYEIIASEMKMIGGKGDSSSAVQDEPKPQPVQREQASAPIVDDLSDDLPF